MTLPERLPDAEQRVIDYIKSACNKRGIGAEPYNLDVLLLALMLQMQDLTELLRERG